MVPVNQVILNSDPLLNHIKQNEYWQGLQCPLWNEIDRELSTLTELQIKQLHSNDVYATTYSKLQELVTNALLETVKAKIENTPLGRDLLQTQLNTLRAVKSQIIESTNRELEVLQRFKEYSQNNPNITYTEFLKMNNYE